MKKYLIILLLIAFILPSVAFASWYNPFSWFYNWTFHKTEITTDNPGQKITVPTTTTTNDVSKKVITSIIKNQTKNLPVPVIVKTIPKKDATSSPAVIPSPQQPISVVPSKTNDQQCQDSFGSNSSFTGQKKTDGGLICGCESGYDWNNNQTSCIAKPVKTGYQICRDTYGNATWDGTSYTSSGGPNCSCDTGYTISSDSKSCVTIVTKTGYQVCSESYSNEIWDGTMANGKYNCVCQTGYGWNSTSASCQSTQQAQAQITPLLQQIADIKQKALGEAVGEMTGSGTSVVGNGNATRILNNANTQITQLNSEIYNIESNAGIPISAPTPLFNGLPYPPYTGGTCTVTNNTVVCQ